MKLEINGQGDKTADRSCLLLGNERKDAFWLMSQQLILRNLKGSPYENLYC